MQDATDTYSRSAMASTAVAMFNLDSVQGRNIGTALPITIAINALEAVDGRS